MKSLPPPRDRGIPPRPAGFPPHCAAWSLCDLPPYLTALRLPALVRQSPLESLSYQTRSHCQFWRSQSGFASHGHFCNNNYAFLSASKLLRLPLHHSLLILCSRIKSRLVMLYNHVFSSLRAACCGRKTLYGSRRTWVLTPVGMSQATRAPPAH